MINNTNQRTFITIDADNKIMSVSNEENAYDNAFEIPKDSIRIGFEEPNMYYFIDGKVVKVKEMTHASQAIDPDIKYMKDTDTLVLEYIEEVALFGSIQSISEPEYKEILQKRYNIRNGIK